jgi:hypothetical protein
MGKRSDFPRSKNDDYVTPAPAVLPLLPFLTGVAYTEPCAGNRGLVEILDGFGIECASAYDVADGVDARTAPYPLGEIFITNPPWTREVMHPIIENLRVQKPAWLLFDADWAHTKQAAPYLKFCRKIVAVGRVKWMPGTRYTGKDNAAWHLFHSSPGDTIFVGHAVKS